MLDLDAAQDQLDQGDIPDMRETVRAQRTLLIEAKQRAAEQQAATVKLHGDNRYKWPSAEYVAVQTLDDDVARRQRELIEAESYLGELLAGRALVAELRVTRAVAEAADRVMHGVAVQSELRAALTAWHQHHGEVR